ncbi:TPA: hypothetical protein ACF351_001541 [Clostridium perfringens]|uniref:hypothetical protein n=1 Tax=Clostridium perfringens TaxID=1502 RepID=UPI002468450B|nr:hypothetical protein [Clostridium perfringens]MDH5099555.1 hypothetical protein [Clostridium perfringens]
MGFNSKVKEGYLDLFYAFKLKDKNLYKKINKDIVDLNCVISNINGKKISLKEEYENYLKYYLYRAKENFQVGENCLELDDIKINFSLDINDSFFEKSRQYKVDLESLEIVGSIYNTVDSECSVSYLPNEEDFVRYKMQQLVDLLEENNNYSDNELAYILKPYILQPIKIYEKEKKTLSEFINVYLWVYTSGCLIIQYTVPISNSNIENWTKTTEKPFDLNVNLPSYIENKDDYAEYIYSKKIENYEKAITEYNKYFFTKLGFERYFEGHQSKLQLFTLNKYDNMPKDFGKMNKNNELKRDFFWIINSPYGYVNETIDSRYNEFFEQRYTMNKYASVFAGTHNKILVAWNNSLNTIYDPKYKEYIERNKYFISIGYLLLAIHNLLMKKVYYNSLLEEPYNDLISKKDIIIKKQNLTYIKDYMFYVTRYAYGSLIDVSEYLESTMTYFLQDKSLNKKMEVYNQIVELKESQEKENNNFLISFLAVLITILLGVDAIDKITQLIKNRFNFDFTNFNFEIWFILFLASISLFLYLKFKHNIKCLRKIFGYRCRKNYYRLKSFFKNFD